ncbi:MAG: hemerythrin domain-containing protein [Ilumatobacteraceae bacterium]
MTVPRGRLLTDDMFQADLPRAVLGFVGVHLGLRAEAAHIGRLLADGDRPGATRRAELLATVLHHHHRAEDTVLFPALADRLPGAATSTVELERQHVELDAVLGRLAKDVNDADEVAMARDVLDRHLVAEEAHVLPMWLTAFTAAEHERFAARLRRSTPLRDAGLMIAWLLDTAPNGAEDVAWSQVPPALRLMHRVWWRPRYERAFGRMDGAVVSWPGLAAPAMAMRMAS